MRCVNLSLGLIMMTLLGCGTTKWTDTGRSATEQLLISDAMDRAISQLDFRALAGRNVFLDTTHIKGVTDSSYLISSLRQHMLASGCILRDAKDKADYAAEVRVGAVGTDRNEMMFGVPSVSLPVPVAVTGVPASIPEMQLAKKTKQRAVVKMAVFAYNVKTGRPVWQSGILPVESSAKDVWIAGAGPFQTGTIYEKTNFAGDEIDIPLIDFHSRDSQPVVAVADDAFFVDELPAEEKLEEKPKETAVAQDAKSPKSSQTAQSQPNSPPVKAGDREKTAIDPAVIPAAHHPTGKEELKKQSPEVPSVKKKEETKPAKPSVVPFSPPSKSSSALTLRLPESRKPAALQESSSETPPLPVSDAGTNQTPPNLLNLDGVRPIPLQLPKSTAEIRRDSLGLPPLPPHSSTMVDRAPACLTPSDGRP